MTDHGKVLHLVDRKENFPKKSPFPRLTTDLLVSIPEFNLREYNSDNGSGGSDVGM